MSLLKALDRTKCLIKNKAPLLGVLQQNSMAWFPDYYAKPTVKHEDQAELIKTGRITELMNVPVKPALNDQLSSHRNDPRVNQFINRLMKDGKKVLARGLVEEAFKKIKRIQIEKYHKCKTEEEKAKIEVNPNVIFHRAIDNCRPLVRLTPIKRGGVTYQVPVPVTDAKAEFMSMKWLILAGQDKERTVHFPEKLAYELIDAANNTGRVVKQKIELHKQCEANRAYAHYRWS